MMRRFGKAAPNSLPEELARNAGAHEEERLGGKVWMTCRVVLPRAVAEALAARSIREEKSIGTLVTERLSGDEEAAVSIDRRAAVLATL